MSKNANKKTFLPLTDHRSSTLDEALSQNPVYEFSEVKNKHWSCSWTKTDPNRKEGIYAIVLPKMESSNFAPIYVGQSQRLEHRIYEHWRNLKDYFNGYKASHDEDGYRYSNETRYLKIVEYLKLYNLSLNSIKFVILESNFAGTLSKEELCNREQEWYEILTSGKPNFNGYKPNKNYEESDRTYRRMTITLDDESKALQILSESFGITISNQDAYKIGMKTLLASFIKMGALEK